MKAIRITEGFHEVEQVITILTVENEIVENAKELLKDYSRLFYHHGNLDGDGFVKYLQHIYGEKSVWLLKYDKDVIFDYGEVR